MFKFVFLIFTSLVVSGLTNPLRSQDMQAYEGLYSSGGGGLTIRISRCDLGTITDPSMQILCDATKGAQGPARLCGYKFDISTGKESDAVMCAAPNPQFKGNTPCGPWPMKGGSNSTLLHKTERIFLGKRGPDITFLQCVIPGDFAECGAHMCDNRIWTSVR